MVDDTEKAIFALVEKYNAPSIFTFRRFRLKPDTDLNNDFCMDPLDAYDLMEQYTEQFGIEPKDIDFEHYFPDYGDAQDSLTIQLLIDSAKAGRWLGK
ncbi:acyl carrier protein [Mixta theicola]|uniref:Acyl carrier protein n=1 Tax=Mixta theicola TaxID=1458355 RepID=A0A2K1QBK4_9GAMM|nr:DUF1493 family protein [Mixta theicola]PNS12408.1 acyl carrier protein [Mixta theicola]GLR08171.1 acyl carrier protein [Mixta theicola]